MFLVGTMPQSGLLGELWPENQQSEEVRDGERV